MAKKNKNKNKGSMCSFSSSFKETEMNVEKKPMVGGEGSVPNFLKELDSKPKTCGSVSLKKVEEVANPKTCGVSSFEKKEESNVKPAGMCMGTSFEKKVEEKPKTCGVSSFEKKEESNVKPAGMCMGTSFEKKEEEKPKTCTAKFNLSDD